jgi:hypothetical protein
MRTGPRSSGQTCWPRMHKSKDERKRHKKRLGAWSYEDIHKKGLGAWSYG